MATIQQTKEQPAKEKVRSGGARAAARASARATR
jgi:hypothetical protein